MIKKQSDMQTCFPEMIKCCETGFIALHSFQKYPPLHNSSTRKKQIIQIGIIEEYFWRGIFIKTGRVKGK
jgi:hypothetical protein